MLEAGIRGEQSVAVTSENTAKTMGSGTLDVFATPALVALAEKTCWMSVAAALEAGSGTVGTRLELEHTAPTPVGMTVTCESELVAVEGRKLVFKVSLHDEKKARWAAACTSAVHHQQRQVCRKGRGEEGGNGLALQSAPLAKLSSPKGAAFGMGRLACINTAALCPLPSPVLLPFAGRRSAGGWPVRWRGTAQNTALYNPAWRRPPSVCISVGSLPRSLRPDTPDEPRRQ